MISADSGLKYSSTFFEGYSYAKNTHKEGNILHNDQIDIDNRASNYIEH